MKTPCIFGICIGFNQINIRFIMQPKIFFLRGSKDENYHCLIVAFCHEHYFVVDRRFVKICANQCDRSANFWAKDHTVLRSGTSLHLFVLFLWTPSFEGNRISLMEFSLKFGAGVDGNAPYQAQELQITTLANPGIQKNFLPPRPVQSQHHITAVI